MPLVNNLKPVRFSSIYNIYLAYLLDKKLIEVIDNRMADDMVFNILFSIHLHAMLTGLASLYLVSTTTFLKRANAKRSFHLAGEAAQDSELLNNFVKGISPLHN